MFKTFLYKFNKTCGFYWGKCRWNGNINM